MAEAVQGQDVDPYHAEDLALCCADDMSDDDAVDGFAVNENTGVLHILAPADSVSRRTLCGRCQDSPGFTCLHHYADSFVMRGELRAVSHCTQCASIPAWTALVDEGQFHSS